MDNLGIINTEEGLFIRTDFQFTCGHIIKKIVFNTTTLSDQQVKDHVFNEDDAISIKTVKDIFTLILPENFDNFITDLNNLYVVSKNLGMTFGELPFYNDGKNNIIITIVIPHTYEYYLTTLEHKVEQKPNNE